MPAGPPPATTQRVVTGPVPEKSAAFIQMGIRLPRPEP